MDYSSLDREEEAQTCRIDQQAHVAREAWRLSTYGRWGQREGSESNAEGLDSHVLIGDSLQGREASHTHPNSNGVSLQDTAGSPKSRKQRLAGPPRGLMGRVGWDITQDDSWHLSDTHCVLLEAVLSVLGVLTRLIFTAALWGRYCYYHPIL